MSQRVKGDILVAQEFDESVGQQACYRDIYGVDKHLGAFGYGSQTTYSYNACYGLYIYIVKLLANYGRADEDGDYMCHESSTRVKEDSYEHRNKTYRQYIYVTWVKMDNDRI